MRPHTLIFQTHLRIGKYFAPISGLKRGGCEEGQAAMGRQLFVGGVQLEGQKGLRHHVYHLVRDEWQKGWSPVS